MATTPAGAFGGLGGMVVAVTGGTQGLGEATARVAAAWGAAGVAVIGRDRARGEAVAGSLGDAGTDAVFVGAELADPESPARALAAVDARFGRVDGLVNAAAETDRGSVWDTSAELVDRLLAVNVRAPMLLAQAAARIMVRERAAGSIVNVGSVAGYGGDVFLLPYATSKGALHAMTRNLAFALLRSRIRVNLVNPGWMDTPAEDAIQRRYHDAGDDWRERVGSAQPLGRLVDPGEVARTICFLLSPDSEPTTGASVDCDQSVIGGGTSPKPTTEDVWPRPDG